MADTKISALTAQTAVLTTDIVPFVANPAGVPATKKATVSDLLGAPILYSAVPLAGLALTAGTAAQNALPTGQSTFTLEANTTYRFEGKYFISRSGTTGTVSIGFALTGLVANVIRYIAKAINAAYNAVGTAVNMTLINQTAQTVVSATGTTALVIEFEGLIRTGAAGTLIPQLTFSATPTTPTMDAGSYLLFQKWDSDTAIKRGNVA